MRGIESIEHLETSHDFERSFRGVMNFSLKLLYRHIWSDVDIIPVGRFC